MEITSFSTIERPSAGIYKEKGSKFLAFAYPVVSEEEIKTHLACLRKEYYDARHHCYAWMLGAERNRFRAFDDGEPNHSAGDPILGQIRSKGITNVLLVVVRYFGGTKLGVGGLISAYKTAAEEALKNAHILEREISREVTLTFPYESTAEIMRLLKDFDLKILRQQFEEACSIKAEVAISKWQGFEIRVKLMKDVGTPFEIVFD